MTHDFLIVGTGPAGVCAGDALAAAGRQVFFVDGGTGGELKPPPSGKYLELRRAASPWMFGEAALDVRPGDENLSPKSRVPSLEGTFRGFAEAVRITADNFTVVGSLSVGGLSNAWGCGVAAYDSRELAQFPFAADELHDSYARVAAQTGLSGACDDDLAGYFGVDRWAEPAFDLDEGHGLLWSRYQRARERLSHDRFRLGRARVAVLRRPLGVRQPCEQDGLCLWGCSRGALYSSRFRFAELARQPNVGGNGSRKKTAGCWEPWVLRKSIRTI